jgi:DNA-binding response OmpR family regulator
LAEATVLVVDDERNVTQLARLYLTENGFYVDTASNGIEALEKVSQSRPDIIVLDLMMPGMDGFETCRQLRSSPDGDIPIIMLTARGDDVDKIVGLELGADDYLTKPFNPRELVARVKAILRRYRAGLEPARLIEIDGLQIDVDSREVRAGDRVIELRPKEFDLLVTLARNPGVVFDRERLIHLVWGYDFLGDSRTVDVHVAALREKISGATVHIQTVWGIGYKLVATRRAA